MNYHKLSYDTSSTVIFNWDTTLYQFPNNSDPLPLTQEDIKLTDSLLKISIDSFNKHNPLKEMFDNTLHPIEPLDINLSNYKKQFFPYLDVNFEKVVFINCVCNKHIHSDWKKKPLEGRLHSGICQFLVKINLTTKNFYEFSIGGYG